MYVFTGEPAISVFTPLRFPYLDMNRSNDKWFHPTLLVGDYFENKSLQFHFFIIFLPVLFSSAGFFFLDGRMVGLSWI